MAQIGRVDPLGLLLVIKWQKQWLADHPKDSCSTSADIQARLHAWSTWEWSSVDTKICSNIPESTNHYSTSSSKWVWRPSRGSVGNPSHWEGSAFVKIYPEDSKLWTLCSLWFVVLSVKAVQSVELSYEVSTYEIPTKPARSDLGDSF